MFHLSKCRREDAQRGCIIASHRRQISLSAPPTQLKARTGDPDRPGRGGASHSYTAGLAPHPGCERPYAGAASLFVGRMLVRTRRSRRISALPAAGRSCGVKSYPGGCATQARAGSHAHFALVQNTEANRGDAPPLRWRAFGLRTGRSRRTSTASSRPLLRHL